MRDKHRRAVDAVQADPQARDAAVSSLLGQVVRMRGVIDLQRSRLDAASGDAASNIYADADSLINAMARLVRATQALQLLDVAVADDLSSFDESFPTAKPVRDVLEHLDDYLIGAGQLQTEPGLPITLTYRLSLTAGTAVTTTNPDMTFDVGQAIPAALALADNVVTAGAAYISNFRGRGPEASESATID